MSTTADRPPIQIEDPTSPRILIVEDDLHVAGLVHRALRQAGYRTQIVSDGRAAVAAVRDDSPDAVVLDVMLPGLDGLDVARRLREEGSVPILMLTALDAVGDRVKGLDAGGDDYLVKPFALEELLARVRAILRRREVDATDRRSGLLRFADIVLDPDARESTRAGRRLDLRHLEFELLACFLRHPGRVLSRREVFEEVWGYNFLGDSNVIEVTVGHLRQKLEVGLQPRVIHTIRSVGYILRESPAP